MRNDETVDFVPNVVEWIVRHIEIVQAAVTTVILFRQWLAKTAIEMFEDFASVVDCLKESELMENLQ